MEQAALLYYTRQPYPLPTMKINPAVKDIYSFNYEDFELVNYTSIHISKPRLQYEFYHFNYRCCLQRTM